jgi:hypothetical protein
VTPSWRLRPLFRMGKVSLQMGVAPAGDASLRCGPQSRSELLLGRLAPRIKFRSARDGVLFCVAGTHTAVVRGVCYATMSRYNTNADAFHPFVANGIGKPVGTAVSYVTSLAYGAIRTSIYGLFGRSVARYFFAFSRVG